jgi:hypothetical protein
MTSCLNLAVPQLPRRNGKTSKVMMLLPQRWKRLNFPKRNFVASSNAAIQSSFSVEQYAVLDDYDDDDDDVYIETANHRARNYSIGAIDPYFVAQWSNRMITDPTESVYVSEDDDDNDDDDDATDDEIREEMSLVPRRTKPSLDDLRGAFPRIENVSSTLDPPSRCEPEIEISAENGNLSDVGKIDTKTSAGVESDSETEEETSSSSSCGNNEDHDSMTKDLLINETDYEKRRSIRFSDEIEGQELTTIHLVPWTEHDDANWIPRPVRCRIEL